MRIIVLHGDNTQKSYARLQKFIEVAKKRGWEVRKMSNSQQSLAELVVAENLFGAKKLVIVDKIETVSKKDLDWLKKQSLI